jgi:hypothetical protein
MPKICKGVTAKLTEIAIEGIAADCAKDLDG